MIQTYNISLPQNLAHLVDTIVENDGYSSRSELFRMTLRNFLQQHYSSDSIALSLNKKANKIIDKSRQEMNQNKKIPIEDAFK